MALRLFAAAFLLISIVNVLAIPEEMLELARSLHNACQAESGAAEELISKAQKGDFTDDQNLKCYIKCLMNELAVMEDDGTVDVEAVIEFLPEEHRKDVEPAVRKCGTVVGADHCENAWLTHKCYYENAPDNKFNDRNKIKIDITNGGDRSIKTSDRITKIRKSLQSKRPKVTQDNNKNMSHIVAVCLVLIASATQIMSMSEELKELANMLHEECQGESGVPEELIVNARKGDFSSDNTLKCYIKCLMTQMAVIEDDGTIDEEAMIAIIPEEYKVMASRVIKTCGTKRGSDVCDTVWLTHQCYYKEAPEGYYLP
ncbi:PREDICTED: uncharacterized protein LOC108568658 [Nicrophorus vespilloides]|uniref:Uncharacterized protein LOC108568658 n=1 Tax=Nicrophorus vespilloides TaxID=110193 RepID=A0ABM1NEV4_NICVS|nr:PREDICTED: uncharacterized protein LOC108568658 [Nicrophorus vespilloides]